MSKHEKFHGNIESGHEDLDLHEAEKHSNLERLNEEVESTEHDHNIDKIHESIHKEALSTEEITVGDHHNESNKPILGIQKELKEDSYRRTIQKVRNNLNPAERAMSKVIHNRVVEPVSEFSSKTVARPSGIFGGGLVALIGSGAVLYMAKHYGFEYNFTTFIVLITGGFAVGLLVEILIHAIRKTRT